MVSYTYMRFKQAFVTGASGFVGRALVDELIGNNIKIVALTRDKDNSDLPHEVRMVTGDLNSLSKVSEVIWECDVVFHLAARTPGSGASKEDYEFANVQGTANVIEGCMLNRKRLVYISSVNVELFRQGKIADPYSETKSRAEKLVENAVQAELDAVIVRPAYVFGNVSGRAGNLVDRSLGKGMPVLVAPDRLFCPVFVGDLARATRLAAESGERGAVFTIAGDCVTLREFVGRTCAASGQRNPRFTVPTWLGSMLLKTVWGIRPVTRWTPPITVSAFKTDAVFDGTAASAQLGFEYTPIERLFGASDPGSISTGGNK